MGEAHGAKEESSTMTMMMMRRVTQHPALGHHDRHADRVKCEPQALGEDLPTVTDRGLARQSARHADRSEGSP